MQKKLLKLGRNIFPNNLKINKQFNIGIVGSGKMAQNYIEIVRSFNHNISAILSLSKNKNAGFRHTLHIKFVILQTHDTIDVPKTWKHRLAD